MPTTMNFKNRVFIHEEEDDDGNTLVGVGANLLLFLFWLQSLTHVINGRLCSERERERGDFARGELIYLDVATHTVDAATSWFIHSFTYHSNQMETAWWSFSQQWQQQQQQHQQQAADTSPSSSSRFSSSSCSSSVWCHSNCPETLFKSDLLPSSMLWQNRQMNRSM